MLLLDFTFNPFGKENVTFLLPRMLLGIHLIIIKIATPGNLDISCFSKNTYQNQNYPRKHYKNIESIQNGVFYIFCGLEEQKSKSPPPQQRKKVSRIFTQ